MAEITLSKVVWSARAAMFIVIFAVSTLLGLLTAGPAHATTFTVNSASDPGNGGCNATECTLREAITAANSASGADTINFAIPSAAGSASATGVKTITPAAANGALPTITEQLTIDGYTQSGASANTLTQGTNAVLKVGIDGSNVASSPANGLTIGASNTVVRGLVINHFSSSGISIRPRVSGVRVQGNFIGTDATGTVDLGNSGSGVSVVSADDNIVGGSTHASHNLISGNGGSGVSITDLPDLLDPNAFPPRRNKILGNLIGTEKDGISRLGNSGSGVDIFGGSDTFVGAASAGSANTIAFNAKDGVLVGDAEVPGFSPIPIVAEDNRILSNSIFSNGGIGINLLKSLEGSSVVTANDPGDTDTSPNCLQNKPALTSAVTSGGKTTIKGRLNSTPNQIFLVQFFSNPSGSEGKTFIGQKRVTTDASGNVSFVFRPERAVAVGRNVTATATDPDGNTSEFSPPRTVVKP